MNMRTTIVDCKYGLSMRLAVIVIPFWITLYSNAMASECDLNLSNAYGPYDYTNPSDVETKLYRVEKAHFTSEIRNAANSSSGMPPVDVMHNLDYTLRAFPNHHNALYAMVNFLLHLRGTADQTATYLSLTKRFKTAECYLERAIKFKPDDAVVYEIYGIYLYKSGDMGESLKKFKEAVRINENLPSALYNVGLIYYKRGNSDEAYKYAKRAYDLGYQLPYLKNQLQKIGKWHDESQSTE